MNKHDPHESETDKFRDEGFIVATGQRAVKSGVTRYVISQAGKNGLNKAEPNNERDESDDLETEKAADYAKSM